MKKITAVVLSLVLLLGLSACQKAPAASADVAPLTLLKTAWDAMPEESKFPAFGGSYESNVDGEPGQFPVTDAAALESLLVVPADAAALMDDAASLIHMMNLNTFTCGAFHTAGAEDAGTLAGLMHDALQSRHWMCGFPDKLVIATYGGDVVAMFGLEELINAFRDALQTSYPDLVIVYDEPIV